MKARILLAGPDSTAARVLTDRLHGLGHTVCAAASAGREAVEQASDLRPDLALVDLDPPGGVEAGAGIGELGVPVVYLAGDLDDAALRRARETRPFGYVVKPPDDRQLRLTIDAALSRRVPDGRERGRRDAEPRLSALQARNDLLEAVIQGMADAVVVTDEHGKFVLSNRALREAFGVDPQGFADREQALGRYDVFEADEKTPLPGDRTPLPLAMKGTSTSDVRMFVRPRGGAHGVHIAVSGRPLRDWRGRVGGGVVVFRDVSRQTRAERELERTIASLRNQTELMDSVIDVVSDAVAVFDADHRCVMRNAEARRIAGVGAEVADLDRALAERDYYLTADGSPCPPENLPSARAVRGETFDNLGVWRNAPSGGRTFFSISGRPLWNPDGTLRAAVVVYRDVTEDRRKEAELRELAEKLYDQKQAMETVFASISDGVVVADAQGRLTMANRSAERIVGMGITDDGPDKWAATYGTFFPDKKTPFPSDRLPLARAIRGDPSDSVHLFIRNPHVPDGVHISVSGRPMRDAAGELTGGVIVLRDVTRSVESREALLEAFAHGRLEVIDTVLHNIGNAINSVSVGVQTLDEHARNDSVLQRFTALADAVSAHRDDWIDWLSRDPQGRNVRPFLLALVEDLQSRNESLRATVERVSERVRHILDIIRTQESFTDATVERKAVELRPAILEAVNVLEDSLAKRGIPVEVECAGAPAEVLLQESKFHQMLVNLLKNAMEAIDALAAAEGRGAREPRIRVVAREQKKCLVIDVTDNGIGIGPDRLPKIFTAGYTSKDDGSGLGLHSAANYVVATGGSIEPLSGGVGRGTTMRVTLRLPDAPGRPRGGENT